MKPPALGKDCPLDTENEDVRCKFIFVQRTVFHTCRGFHTPGGSLDRKEGHIMNKQGFTIWELLAVIIIIVIIAALLFPIFAKGRECSRCPHCITNEKQLGLAIMQVGQDNDGQMPNIAAALDPKVTWRTTIYPYAKSKGIFLCPDRGVKDTGPNPKFDTIDGFPTSYAANYTGDYSGHKNDKGEGAFAGPGSKPISDKDIPDPSSLIVLCEVWHTRRAEFNIDNLGAFNPGSDMLWAGQPDGSNYLLGDGHVKYFKPLATKDMWHRDARIPLSAGAVKVLGNAHKSDQE
jgi:prepilin-type N-terminal cleavage/methylation domain-containing protein/prepilin-type processing-associated H-X9-DG protein